VWKHQMMLVSSPGSQSHETENCVGFRKMLNGMMMQVG